MSKNRKFWFYDLKIRNPSRTCLCIWQISRSWLHFYDIVLQKSQLLWSWVLASVYAFFWELLYWIYDQRQKSGLNLVSFDFFHVFRPKKHPKITVFLVEFFSIFDFRPSDFCLWLLSQLFGYFPYEIRPKHCMKMHKSVVESYLEC